MGICHTPVTSDMSTLASEKWPFEIGPAKYKVAILSKMILNFLLNHILKYICIASVFKKEELRALGVQKRNAECVESCFFLNECYCSSEFNGQ
jgi:hypothetical protein